MASYWSGGYPRPTNSTQDTKQMPRSSEGGDKPHPYIGYMLHCCTLPRVGAGFIPALPIADKIQSKKTAAAGFIPVLPTEDKIQSKCPAASRVGINPTPTWMYAANVLLSAVYIEIMCG